MVTMTVLLLLLLNMCSNAAEHSSKRRTEQRSRYIGTQVLINGDSNVVVAYDRQKGSYQLSNGVYIDTLLIKQYKQ